MLERVGEQAIINLPCDEKIDSLSMEKVVFPGSKVDVAVGIEEYSLTVLKARNIFSGSLVFSENLSDILALVREIHFDIILKSLYSTNVVLLFLFVNRLDRFQNHRSGLSIH